MQNLVGKNWQQGNRAAEQDREKTESDRRQDNLFAENESSTRGQAAPCALFLAFNLLRAWNRQCEEVKQGRGDRIDRINNWKAAMRDDKSAQRGPDDRAD